MKDAISRQAALDIYDDYNVAVENGELEAYGKYRKRLLKLSSVTPQQRWIPVEERLPNRDEYIKNNGLFIVSDGNRNYSEWFDIYDKQKFGEPTMSGFRVDYVVIAWMSLPEEPYRAEGSDKE